MNYYCIYITIGSFKLSSCQFSTKSLLEWKYKLRSRPYSDMFMHYVWMGSYNRQYWKAISYAFLAVNTNVCVFLSQLVSRLEGRPSLRDIEPNIFPVDSGPRQGAVKSNSPFMYWMWIWIELSITHKLLEFHSS